MILNEFFIYISIFWLSLISPGPDFTITIRYSLAYGLKAGIYISLGITTAITIHLTYTIFGISALINNFPILLKSILTISSLYLFYSAYNIIKDYINTINKNNVYINDKQQDLFNKQNINLFKQTFIKGFITNVLNVKCGLFFLSIFSPLIAQSKNSLYIYLLFPIVIISTLVWFSFISIIFSKKQIRDLYLKKRFIIDTIISIIFIILGLYLLYTVWLK